MNYLDAVNSVLSRLREDQVTSVNQNEQSRVIGVLLNDALRECEDAWDWQAKLTTDVIVTAADVSTYTIDDSAGRITINDIYNTTNKMMLNHISKRAMRQKQIMSPDTRSAPFFWAEGLTKSNGDNQIEIFPTPNAIYNLSVSYYQRSTDLAASGDTIAIPHQPVVLLAYAKAAQERGDNPQSVALLYKEAQRSLSDAIAYDAALDDDDITWEVV